MKNFIVPFLAIFVCLVISCNTTDKNNNDHSDHTQSGNEPQTLADSLMKDIDDGHIIGMSKIGKLHNTQKEVLRIIDSVGKLPAAAQQVAASYVTSLKAVTKDLEYADFAMDKWMTEFEKDSAINNMEQQIKYLADEKVKVGKIKEAIITSLQKADSLLKVKL